ncbi:MAG: DNA mismatch repair endonuclease MutL [Gilvibacter sp.]
MADIIQLLPDHVANQIAAGEVVQRPASVVKELLENAVDAGASHIKLVIKDAGKRLIQVIDDGVGMSEADATACFDRHATSKISTAQDLFALNTKGFRGEALASIAAIAKVELKTRQKGDELGTHVKIEGSKIVSQESCVTNVGTVVTVKNLFYNIPARRNFLKSTNVELRHIIDQFHRVALAHPDIAFDLDNNDSALFNLPKASLKQRIIGIFGAKTKERLVPVTEQTELIKVDGFVLKPEFAKKSRGDQYFFVNDRFIKSSYLHHAVLSAYEGLLAEKSNPGYILYLTIAPEAIDINIHPTKTEIKFENEQAIYAVIRATVKHSLGQFSIAPVLDFNRDSALDTPYDYRQKAPKNPTIEVDPSFNPFKEESKTNYGGGFKKPKPQQWESLYTGFKQEQELADSQIESLVFEAPESNEMLFTEPTQPSFDNCFQLQAKYIASPIKSGLLLVHQNRAHQRVLFETFLANAKTGDGISQQLLFPLELRLSKPDLALLLTSRETLEQMGFVISKVGEEAIFFEALPVKVGPTTIEQLIDDLLADLQSFVPSEQNSMHQLMARSMAHNLAIKTGHILKKDEQKQLIHELFACNEPAFSPSNKVVFKTFSLEDLDKNF